MISRPIAPLWSTIYAIIGITVILVLLQLLGVIVLSSALANVLYLIAIFSVIVAVTHAIGLLD